MADIIRVTCQPEVRIDADMTFAVICNAATGAATDVTGDLSYEVYENESGMSLTGTLAKLDGKTGLYAETITCSAANGFENGKSYTIYVYGTVAGVAGAGVASFAAYNNLNSSINSSSEHIVSQT